MRGATCLKNTHPAELIRRAENGRVRVGLERLVRFNSHWQTDIYEKCAIGFCGYFATIHIVLGRGMLVECHCAGALFAGVEFRVPDGNLKQQWLG